MKSKGIIVWCMRLLRTLALDSGTRLWHTCKARWDNIVWWMPSLRTLAGTLCKMRWHWDYHWRRVFVQFWSSHILPFPIDCLQVLSSKFSQSLTFLSSAHPLTPLLHKCCLACHIYIHHARFADSLCLLFSCLQKITVSRPYSLEEDQTNRILSLAPT